MSAAAANSMQRTARRRGPGATLTLFLTVAVLLAGGCRGGPLGTGRADELTAARERVEELEAQNADLQRRLAEKDERIETLLVLGEKRLDKLFHVAAIEIGRYTGGIDTDGEAGHDAVKVYLRPLDAAGSPIKAAGTVRIELFDLAARPPGRRLGVYDWGPDEIGRRWFSSAFTYHYSFICPWQAGRPSHETLTVRVTFTDYLTGKTFTAQRACKVALPPPGE